MHRTASAFKARLAQSMNIVDRSRKGDRLSGGQQTYGQAASGSVEVGNVERGSRDGAAPWSAAITKRCCRSFRMAANPRSVRCQRQSKRTLPPVA